ncbi:protein kinase [Gemmatimonadota bacterium]
MPDLLERLKSALGERYGIEEEIGRGGMATVFLAEDLRHDRKVAIKVLHPELAASLGTDRFLHEIKIVAGLQHPHVLPLYDSGEADGFLYYVMPYVEGESLADCIKRESQLSLNDALRYAQEVADALHYAHEHGIVHRDVKPDNIMITSGHAVVADFGIASAVSAAGGSRFTQTGMTVGTPHYMSPEQASGTVDARSDIYSLGCTLYEMLVGTVPFFGTTPQAVVARHAADEVPRPTIVRATIPEELEDALLCAMNKVPSDRFKTTAEFSEALAAVDTSIATHRRPRAAPAVHPSPKVKSPHAVMKVLLAVAAAGIGLAVWQLLPRFVSIPVNAENELDPKAVAVLYFDDLTPDGEFGYLADGLTESLIDLLSQVRELEVLSGNAVAPFRTGSVTPDSIARALNVGSLIRGSVEQTGERVRVTARFVDGASGADFDRRTLELPRTDLLVLRDSLAQVVSTMFRRRLGQEIRLRERLATTTSVEAWSSVQQAERTRKEAERLIGSGETTDGFAAFDQADSKLAEAEGHDPLWVEPTAFRALIAYRRSRLSEGRPEILRWVDVGNEHADRALRIDPNHPQALEARGTLRYWAYLNDREPNPDDAQELLLSAKADLEAAVSRDPSLASAYATLSHLYYNTEEGVTSVIIAARTAYQEDAYLDNADVILWRLFTSHYDSEQLNQARRWCSVGESRFPQSFRFQECQLLMMATRSVEPNVEKAWRLHRQLTRLVPEPMREIQSRRAQMHVAGVIGLAGLTDSARSVAVRARATAELDPDFELMWHEAYARVLMGDHDEAIRLLKTYMTATSLNGIATDATGTVFWRWRDLTDHPRFEEIGAP